MDSKRSARSEPARGTKRGSLPSRAPRAVVILSAYPRRASAEQAARSLVRRRILACATVVSGGRAFYIWSGRERAEPSVLFWGKTSAARAAEAVRALRASHPDRVPEILVLPIQGGDTEYLRWLAGEVKNAR